MPRHIPMVIVVAVLLLITASVVRADDGAAVYKGKCAACHGADGSGDTAMGKKLGLKSLASADIQKHTDDELTKTITDGKGKMPPFKTRLTPAEIKAVVAAVRTFKK